MEVSRRYRGIVVEMEDEECTSTEEEEEGMIVNTDGGLR